MFKYLVVRQKLKPTIDGPIIYINALGRLSKAVSKVKPSGGKIIIPFIDLGKFGFAAIIIDCEGNRMYSFA